MPPDQAKLLRIYLDDHQTVLLGGCELVRRMSRREGSGELAMFLAELLPELEDDRSRVTARIREDGGSPSVVKPALARLAVQAGRLKLNGSLTKPSPLSPLLELEGLRAVLDASRSLWRTLERTDGATSDYGERAERAERRLDELEGLRLAVAEAALGFGRTGGR